MNAQDALNKSKVHLMVKPGAMFLSSISIMLNHELDSNVSTAATDGITIKYNPDFFLSLTPEQRIGLLAHEVWHVAFAHMNRRMGRKPMLWNMAADYVINLLLVENNFVLPPDGLLNNKFAGLSTEQVYELLKETIDEKDISFNSDLIESDDIEENIEKITNIVVRAKQQAELSDKYGKLPQEIVRVIDDLINPRLSWSEVLYRFLDSKIKEHYSWNKPNKKYLPNFYLPSQYSESINKLTIAIDTSGSMPNEFLQKILSEINYINQTFKPGELTILDCDSRIHNIYTINSFDLVSELKFTGSGGTNFMPVIKYCNEQDTNLLIYFTDLYGIQISEEPAYPVVWVCYSNHTPALIGETIYANL